MLARLHAEHLAHAPHVEAADKQRFRLHDRRDGRPFGNALEGRRGGIQPQLFQQTRLPGAYSPAHRQIHRLPATGPVPVAGQRPKVLDDAVAAFGVDRLGMALRGPERLRPVSRRHEDPAVLGVVGPGQPLQPAPAVVAWSEWYRMTAMSAPTPSRASVWMVWSSADVLETWAERLWVKES